MNIIIAYILLTIFVFLTIWIAVKYAKLYKKYKPIIDIDKELLEKIKEKENEEKSILYLQQEPIKKEQIQDILPTSI